MDERLREEFKSKINFFVIGLISFVAIAAIPFLSTAFEHGDDQKIIQQAFPDSIIGWIVWGIFRSLIVIINMSILVAFVNQGRINVSKNENFIESMKKWIDVQVYKGKKKSKKKHVYLTPKQHYAALYTKKGVSLAITSFASCFTITFMILHWDLATFIMITITVLFAVVFGFLQMQKEEFYWLNDFKIIADVEYSKMLEEKNKEVIDNGI